MENDMKRIFMPALLFALLSTPFLYGCSDKVGPGETRVERKEIIGVTLAAVKTEAVEETVEATGTVKAKAIAVISSKATGTVTTLNVKEGTVVRKGAVLLTIEDRDISQKLKAAEAGKNEAEKGLEAAKENLALAENTYERYKKLYDGKAVSRQEFDQIETQKKTAQLEYERMQEAVKRSEAGVAETKVYRGYAKVTAPFNGVITEKKTDIGMMASLGTALLTIEDTSSFILEAYADESLSGKLKAGDIVDIHIESTDEKLKGKVTEAVPSINPATRTFLVKIFLNGKNLKSGLYARVKLPGKEKELITVPSSALVYKGQLTGVYTVGDKGVATYRLVRTGSRFGDRVEVLSGLSPNERVIAQGVEKAFDGGVVK